MVWDFHKVCFGDFKFFRHQISGRLEIVVRLLHAHDLDDLSTVLFEVGSECLKKSLAQFVTCASGSAAGFSAAWYKRLSDCCHLYLSNLRSARIQVTHRLP